MGVVQFGWDGIRMRLCQIIIVAFVAPGDLGSSWCRKARTRHLVLVHLVGFDNSPSLRLGFSVENSTPYRIPSSHDLSSR
ncbi:hypothetical protein B0T09DRAFT_335091 [Sordaria sp. MPI-SDFR-AT-0083]|nr:hypothetical protein B0T09DRAFT_335091 [Sordaria sp. MPI-SDFR-AT-0083]